MSAAVQSFLAASGWGQVPRQALAGDASARRYERLRDPARGQDAILMIAPAADRASFDAFLKIARHLRAHGLSAPQIWAADADQGLMLMEDFGDDLLARLVDVTPEMRETLYTHVTDLLTHLTDLPMPQGLDNLSPTRLTEMTAPVFDILPDRADAEALRLAVWPELSAALQFLFDGRQVLVLRDVHAENLLWLPDRVGHARLGLLDFQDALAGPVGYDLISLLDDARRDVPLRLKRAMIQRQAKALGLADEMFQARCAALTLQRNLRICGVFHALAAAGKPGYLRFLPRVVGHIRWALTEDALYKLVAPVETLLAQLRNAGDVP